MDLGAVISSIRDRLAVVAGRREELERQCADVEREYARLAAAVSVFEEHAESPVQPSGSEAVAEPPPLTARVFDALLGSSANSRSDLLRLFRPLGVNENSLDSAIQRLKQRGTIQQRGKYLVPGIQTPVPASSPPSPDDAGGSDVDRRSPDPHPVGVEAGPDQGPLPGVVAVSEQEPRGRVSAQRSSPGRIPLTVRVQEAVATSVACTRGALVKHFALQGIKESAVDTALSGLRKRGKLEKRDRRLWVVSGSDVPSPAADPAPLDS